MNSLPLSVVHHGTRLNLVSPSIFLVTLTITNPFLPLSLIFYVITFIMWEGFIISSCDLSNHYALALKCLSVMRVDQSSWECLHKCQILQ